MNELEIANKELSKMKIEIKLKPLSKEEVEQKLEKLGYSHIFEEIAEDWALGDLVSRIAKLLVAYHEDPDTALDLATELVFDWATEELYPELHSVIASNIVNSLDDVAFSVGRDDLKQELKKKKLW